MQRMSCSGESDHEVDISVQSDDDESLPWLSSSDEEDEEFQKIVEEYKRAKKQQKEQKCEKEEESIFNNVTVIAPDELEAEVVFNDTEKPMMAQTFPGHKPVKINPAELKLPCDFTRDEHFEQQAFYYHFPHGNFCLDHKRPLKLTPSKYFCARILHQDQRFCKDPDYIFMAQQFVEKTRVQQEIDVALKKAKPINSDLKSFGTLNTSEFHAVQGRELTNIFAPIPNTPAYWRRDRNELMARLEVLGPFQFFISLSCAEKRWKEITASLLKMDCKEIEFVQLDNGEFEIWCENMPMDEFVKQRIKNKTEFYKDKYIAITRLFDDRLKEFTNNYLKTEDIKAYKWRIEFQMRGLPHVHGVFWLKDEIVKPYLDENGDFKDNVAELADRYISCSLNTGDPLLNKTVEEVQIHSHTFTCTKHGNDCRFHYPRTPSNRTIIAHPLSGDLSDEEKKDKLKEVKSIVQAVTSEIEKMSADELKSTSIDQLLEKVGITSEDYYAALKISTGSGKSIVMKRDVSEVYVNNYNPDMLRAWDANMDLQFCLDPYAVITYITDYLTKDDSGMTEVLKAAIKASKDCTNDFDRLNYIKLQFFKSRQVSVCEAAYRLIPGLHMKDSNTKAKYVGTGFPQNRSQVFKKVYESKQKVRKGDQKNENEMADDGDEEMNVYAAEEKEVDNLNKEKDGKEDEGIEENKTTEDGNEDDDEIDCDSDNEEHHHSEKQTDSKIVTIQGREGKFMETSTLHEKYSMRPDELSNVTFAEFVMAYDVGKLRKDEFLIDGVYYDTGKIKRFDSENYLPEVIRLKNGTIMRCRSQPYILRIHSSSKKQGHEGPYSELMLYLPWRNEAKDLKLNSATECFALYEANEDLILSNRKKVFPYAK